MIVIPLIDVYEKLKHAAEDIISYFALNLKKRPARKGIFINSAGPS